MKILGFDIKRAPRVTPADLVIQSHTRRAMSPAPGAFDGMAHRAFLSHHTLSGVTVSEEGAMALSSVYSCVRLLAESVASLPLKLYRQSGDKRALARDHALYTVLHDQGNDIMTAMQLREVMMVYLCLWGNAYCEIERDRGGRIVALWPIHPSRVTVRVVERSGRIGVDYEVSKTGAPVQTLTERDILHVAGLGFDGLVGKSPIRLHREGIGIAQSAERYGAKFFSNDATPGLVIKHPGLLGGEGYANLKRSWSEAHQGAGNAHKLAILEEGMEVDTVGLPPGDAQFIETRKFERAEIASIFRVPPHMIGDTDRSTSWGTGIEQMGIGFVVHTLRPWLVRIEQAIRMRLLSERERGDMYALHIVDGLLRGDNKSRADYYRSMHQIGVYSINDIRELEDMDAVEGGDQRFVPLNMMPLDGDRADYVRPRAPEDRALPPPEAGRRSAALRHRTAMAMEHVYRDLFGRGMRREIDAIRAAVEEYLSGEVVDRHGFEDWAVRFADEHAVWLNSAARPVFMAMAEAMADLAQDEVGAEIDMAEIERFVGEYSEAYAARHAGATRGQVLDRAREDDPAAAVSQRLSEWEGADGHPPRAEKEARRERARSSNAFARAAWTVAGVTALTWVANQSACPYCAEIVGRTVGIAGAFVPAGGSVGDLQVPRRTSHPPLHDGCECSIVPGSPRSTVTTAEIRSALAVMLDEGAATEAPASEKERRDAEIRSAYPRLKEELGAYAARLELADRHAVSERTVRRVLFEEEATGER